MTAVIITVLLILLGIIIKKLPTADTTNLWLFPKKKKNAVFCSVFCTYALLSQFAPFRRPVAYTCMFIATEACQWLS